MHSTHRLEITIGLLVFITLGSSVRAEEHWNCSVQFECPNAGPNPTCYYSIFYKNGGVKNFSLNKGQTAIIDQLNPLDRWCVDVTGRPRNDCASAPIGAILETRRVCR
jgi:hypothetical protein